MTGADDLVSRVHQHKAACSVRILYISCIKAALSEKCALLIPRSPADRDAIADQAVLRPAIRIA